MRCWVLSGFCAMGSLILNTPRRWLLLERWGSCPRGERIYPQAHREPEEDLEPGSRSIWIPSMSLAFRHPWREPCIRPCTLDRNTASKTHPDVAVGQEGRFLCWDSRRFPKGHLIACVQVLPAVFQSLFSDFIMVCFWKTIISAVRFTQSGHQGQA